MTKCHTCITIEKIQDKMNKLFDEKDKMTDFAYMQKTQMISKIFKAVNEKDCSCFSFENLKEFGEWTEEQGIPSIINPITPEINNTAVGLLETLEHHKTKKKFIIINTKIVNDDLKFEMPDEEMFQKIYNVEDAKYKWFDYILQKNPDLSPFDGMFERLLKCFLEFEE